MTSTHSRRARGFQVARIGTNSARRNFIARSGRSICSWPINRNGKKLPTPNLLWFQTMPNRTLACPQKTNPISTQNCKWRVSTQVVLTSTGEACRRSKPLHGTYLNPGNEKLNSLTGNLAFLSLRTWTQQGKNFATCSRRRKPTKKKSDASWPIF